jgi:membrane protein DedA with SNARE-associated domain
VARTCDRVSGLSPGPVSFGRFVPALRALAAILTGANRMDWPRFLVLNATGGVVWASA